MSVDGDGEIWARTIGHRSFRSRLAPRNGRHCRLSERFAPFMFELAVTAHAQGLDLEIVSARIGPVPLPHVLCPRSKACERLDENGRFSFDVPIAMPGLGRLVHYRGWLEPDDA
jgi:hypothetical protein